MADDASDVIASFSHLPSWTVLDDGDRRFAGAFVLDDDARAKAREARDRVFADIENRGLLRNIGELEMKGYTVLSPEQVGPNEFVSELRDAIVKLVERRNEIDIDLESEITFDNSLYGQVQSEFGLLGEDPIFERALMNGATLAVITYLLGDGCTLSHQRGAVKGLGDQYLVMHADWGGPVPYPAYAQVCNATWVLTDYTVPGGTTCFVPGSHRLCRQPTRYEATDLREYVPVECAAGSVLIWHGNTWHGALPKRDPGIRVSLVQYFSRAGVIIGHHDVTEEMLTRNSARFATLLGHRDPAFRLNEFKADRVGSGYT
jgi:Phytanoyl-CoA dioxygenase (PhyH)